MTRISTITFMLCLLASWAFATSAVAAPCGDADGDGAANLGDVIYIMDYIFAGGPQPASFAIADFDGHQNLTVSDPALMLSTFCDLFEDLCPPDLPPLIPSYDPQYRIIHTAEFRPLKSQEEVALTLASPGAITTRGICLPFMIRVGGAIPVIDSVVFPSSGSQFKQEQSWQFVDHDSGIVALGALCFPNGIGGLDRFAIVHLSMPPTPDSRPITLEWVALTPQQAPTQDSSIIPMVVGYCQEFTKQPLLTPACCRVAGDANCDGRIDIGDAVFTIIWIFGAPGSGCCQDQMDANGDGAVDIGDPVYLLSYIFRGGSAPLCGTSGG